MRWPPKPPHQFPHPPWALTINSATREIDGFYFTVEHADSEPGKAYEVRSELLTLIRKYLRDYIGAARKNSTRELLAAVLRLYAQAMDNRLHHLAFLGFWQCLEIVTLAEDQRGSGESVCNRIKLIASQRCKDDLSAIGDVLKNLRERRNEIVHRGASEGIDHEDARFTKILVEFGIEWLTEYRNRLPSRSHLEKYFQYATTNNASLSATQKAISEIRRNRVAE